MSVRRRAAQQRQNNLQNVEKLLGLWKGASVNDPEILIRVRRAVAGEFTLKTGERVISLFADLVKYTKLKGCTDVQSIPDRIKMHLPNRDTYLHRVSVGFGRNKKGAIKNVVIRGHIQYAIGAEWSTK